MNNLMIDIETLSTRPDAAILSIGAVFFDTESGELGETFHCGVRMKDDDLYGHIDPETVKWWLDRPQDQLDRLITTTDHGLDIINALGQLTGFISDYADYTDTLKVWAKSPEFDLTILSSAIRRSGLYVPWEYYNQRDVRTVLDIGENLLDANTKLEFNGEKHDALNDAIHQANQVIEVYTNNRSDRLERVRTAAERLNGASIFEYRRHANDILKELQQ